MVAVAVGGVDIFGGTVEDGTGVAAFIGTEQAPSSSAEFEGVSQACVEVVVA